MKRLWLGVLGFVVAMAAAIFAMPEALGLAELGDYVEYVQAYNPAEDNENDEYYTPEPDYADYPSEPEPEYTPQPEPEPEPCITEEIYAFMEQFDGEIAVFFENLESGFTFSYQGDRVFFGASATKLPFALYIYLKAEEGRTNLNTTMYFTEGDFWEGSGFIRHRYEYGQDFTQRRLLHLMLAPSDNIATRILRRHHGLNSYREFITSIGGNAHFVQNITYSYLSADEAGLITRESFNYIQSGGRYSHEFLQNMFANRYPFIISDYDVASKSGWAASFGGGWHDMAIVFAPSPYTLSLLSSLDGTPADRAKYDAISMFFQDFNHRHFSGVEIESEVIEPTIITASVARAMMESYPDAVILDVRAQSEFDGGHIPNAVLLPHNRIEEQALDFFADKNTVILVYCRSGSRSRVASMALAEMGFTRVYDFGGIIDWDY